MKRLSNGRPSGAFGSPSGPDPREAGRKGGLASGESRRDRPRRELEERILASANGAALLGLLHARDRRDHARVAERERAVAAREREVAAKEDDLLALSAKADDLTDEIDERYERIQDLQEQRLELEEQLTELRAAIAREADAHDMELVE
jgi:hypothetical protein